jgi:DNA primase
MDQLFPEFDFRLKKDHWQSDKSNRLKSDGTESTSSGGNVYVYQNNPGILKSFKASSPSRNIIAYLADQKGIEWIEAVRYLCEFAGVNFPGAELTEDQVRKRKQQDLWQILGEYFHHLLFTKKGEETLSYLYNRGIEPKENLTYTELGHFPGIEETIAFLEKNKIPFNKALLTQEIKTGEKHRLCISIKNPFGASEGLIFRSLDEQVQSGKYRYSKGAKTSAYLFNQKKDFLGTERLLVTEGQLDALLLWYELKIPAVSIGGSNLSDDQLGLLFGLKPKHLILSLDNDLAGQKATRSTLSRILPNPESEFQNQYVLELEEGVKDANDYFLLKGSDFLQSQIEEATPVHIWLHQILLEDIGYREGQPLSTYQSEQYLNLVAQYSASIRNTLTQGKFIDFFTERAGEAAGITRQTIEDAALELRTREQKKQADDLLLQASRKAIELLRSGDGEQARRHLENRLEQSEKKAVREKTKAYTFLEFEQETREEPDDLSSGIKSLDAVIKIPQSAITLIAARPSHGKTTLMLTMFLNMVYAYPERKFYFFTYEEPAKYLMIKLLNRLLFDHFNYKCSLTFIRAYLAGKHERVPEIEEAKERLRGLVDSQRLNIYSYHLTDIELAQLVTDLNRNKDTGAVFIDYIQKIPIANNLKGYEVIKQVSSTILNRIAIPNQIAVVLGAQFNREAHARKVDELHSDMLREGGDLEQDANLVLGLLNHNFLDAEEDEMGNPLKKGDVAQLDIKVLKNRNGRVGGKVSLELLGGYNYVRDEMGDAVMPSIF